MLLGAPWIVVALLFASIIRWLGSDSSKSASDKFWRVRFFFYCHAISIAAYLLICYRPSLLWFYIAQVHMSIALLFSLARMYTREWSNPCSLSLLFFAHWLLVGFAVVLPDLFPLETIDPLWLYQTILLFCAWLFSLFVLIKFFLLDAGPNEYANLTKLVFFLLYVFYTLAWAYICLVPSAREHFLPRDSRHGAPEDLRILYLLLVLFDSIYVVFQALTSIKT